MANEPAEVAPTPALAPDIAVQTDSVLRITCPSLSDCSTKAWTLLLAVALQKPFLTKAFLPIFVLALKLHPAPPMWLAGDSNSARCLKLKRIFCNFDIYKNYQMLDSILMRCFLLFSHQPHPILFKPLFLHTS
jgi:hypothetical protein